ncbi:UNVERIFIED_CONTAM: hypothetical protein Sradi_4905400 [Sesamum radiatum]|uniref:Uncharacterized protein n=1 Tax=Sesamum radiatum TaxID=300843 RepID=A0AAW2MFG3_SESRA
MASPPVAAMPSPRPLGDVAITCCQRGDTRLLPLVGVTSPLPRPLGDVNVAYCQRGDTRLLPLAGAT